MIVKPSGIFQQKLLCLLHKCNMNTIWQSLLSPHSLCLDLAIKAGRNDAAGLYFKASSPYGMAIVLVSRFTALFEKARPDSNFVLAPNVVAALASGMMVPKNVLSVPIEAAAVGTQNTLVLVAFAGALNPIVMVFAEINPPLERKMYTPGVLKVRFEPTDIPPATQYTPGCSVLPPKS